MAPKDPATSPDARPEALARVVLRCRDLAAFLDASRGGLPERGEAPFLFGQLQEALQGLESKLRAYENLSELPPEKGGFLRRLAGRKRGIQRSAPHYDLEGNAWTIPVTELVGFLAHSGKSGVLWVTSPHETFVLEFLRGSLVHASSSCPPADYRLGEILVREKLLTAAELEQELQNARASDEFLGSHLVNTGRLRHVDLQRALAIQVQQLFHRLMDADSAFYRLQEGARLQRNQSLEVNITQLLLESARKKDEERQLSETRTLQRAEVLSALEEVAKSRTQPEGEPTPSAATAETAPPAAIELPAQPTEEPPPAVPRAPEESAGDPPESVELATGSAGPPGASHDHRA